MMKRMAIAGFLLVLVALPVRAQGQKLRLDFGDLASRARESVEVNLDGPMLRMAAAFLSKDDADERQVRSIVSTLDGIYVKSFEFDKPGEYDQAVVQRVRSQLGATFKPVVTVKSRTEDNVEIYLDSQGDAVKGMVIISAEPTELTVVQIIGPIDLDRLADLEGEFGIPKLESEAPAVRP